MARRDFRDVVVVAYDRMGAFEFGIVAEVFGLARPELDVDWYRFRVCSLRPGPMRTTAGVKIEAGAGLRGLRRAGTIVLPGWRVDDAPPTALLRGLRLAYAEGARLVSVCSGVFALAATGLLDGRRATTHWRYAAKLAERYPRIRVEPDVLYVDEGDVLTSAGSAAGIDLCLHIVRRDYGAEIANQVARRLVVPPHRDGGQAQYVEAAVPLRGSGALAPVLAWAQSSLRRRLSVPALARRAVMSPRTFARRFFEATGTTPHRWLTHQRVLAAQRLLETTSDSVDEIAEAVGLQTATSLRQHFRRQLRTTPTSYRRQFAAAPRGRSAGGLPRKSVAR